MKWHAALKAYFGLKLTDQEITDWGEAIQSATKATGPEVAEVIEWASFKDRKKAYAPTLKELRMWIFWKRKEDGKGNSEPMADGCAACSNSGWVHSYHKPYEQNGAAIPCACSKGDQWRSKYPDEFPENIYRERAKRAVKEWARREREFAETAKESEA